MSRHLPMAVVRLDSHEHVTFRSPWNWTAHVGLCTFPDHHFLGHSWGCVYKGRWLPCIVQMRTHWHTMVAPCSWSPSRWRHGMTYTWPFTPRILWEATVLWSGSRPLNWPASTLPFVCLHLLHFPLVLSDPVCVTASLTSTFAGVRQLCSDCDDRRRALHSGLVWYSRWVCV